MAETQIEEIDRTDQAIAITKRYAAYAGGAAFIPVPGLDLAGIGAVQLKLVKELSDLYEVPFSSNAVKASVTALLSTLVPVQAGIAAASMVKVIPVVGTAIGIATAPAFAGAATYAVGRTFTMHFESGGTVLTFNSDKMRDFFKQEYETATKSRSAAAKSEPAAAAKPAPAAKSAAASKASS